MKFLEKVANSVYKKYGDNLSNVEIIFPTVRAGEFFLKHLQKIVKEPTLSPSIYSIKDWIIKNSNYEPLDDIDLIFKLYEIFRKLDRTEKTFDIFYSWGEMLLRDFNQIDQYLVNTDKFFKNLQNLTEIEIDNLEDDSPEIFKRYMGLRDIIEQTYIEFVEILKGEQSGYMGMLYKDVALNCDRFLNDNKNYIFAGFNILTPSEKMIINTILKKSKLNIYWDYDQYYTENTLQEASLGYFENIETFPDIDINWIENNLSDKKQITVVGTPTKITEAKTAGFRVESFIGEQDETAIVFPDESILFPVLNGIPNDVKDINITMSYNLKETPLFSLIHSITELHENQKYYKKNDKFHYKDLEKIISHPYIQIIEEYYFGFKLETIDKTKRVGKYDRKKIKITRCSDLLKNIKKNNWVFVDFEDIKPLITDDRESLLKLFNTIFSNWNRRADMFDTFFSILDMIKVAYMNMNKGDEKIDWPLELEYIFHFEKNLRKIKHILETQNIDLPVYTFWRVFQQILNSFHIPFTTEKLKGVQLIGLYQTIALDFKNIIILSVNEGVLPPMRVENSFIPFEIRKFYNLPTYKESDSKYGYLFYRLLQRAENITIFYNSEMQQYKKGEKSRFVSQILTEYNEKKNPDTRLIDINIALSASSTPLPKIVIDKDRYILRYLEKIKISPSSLINFITCPLKFYLINLLELDYLDEVKPYPDPAEFGSIVHNILDSLYSDFENRVIDLDILSKIGSQLDQKVIKYYKEITGLSNIDSGRNHLNIEIIKKLLKKFIINEEKRTPFTITSTEKLIYHKIDLKTKEGDYDIILKGFVDRIEKKDDIYNIVDYKTGNVFLNQLMRGWERDIADLPEHSFQLLFYGYLFTKKYGNLKHTLSIYPLKKISQGFNYLKFERDIFYPTERDYTLFENFLIDTIEKIFDIKKPFIQTDDIKNCEYCSFKDICGRD